ncbi:DUF3599 family protein [Geomicrobium sp. JCM 19039]|uniref:DUF3599 family protein n=1 Tax=Geomicrobium sp. JCM 19039 TaxID=1460636 RepID=UPI00045F34A3|nr:DUF3599 family protein [Geomicrobium sp. JCM 19039]GAK11394.1 phage-like element PBSX protein XkdH [Geomicrobium sp. JCM 19039]
MSYEQLLDHKCDVYHLVKSERGPGFGVPIESGQPQFDYPEVPDDAAVPCYFAEKSQSITQGQPGNLIVHRFLIHFLPDTDVRMNDKVVWEGVTYTLQKPRMIKNHHIEVTAVRSEYL